MWVQAAIILLLAIAAQLFILSQPLRPETYLSIPELCALHGYKAEEHFVVTEDGYILSSFRVSKGRASGSPVLLLHGFSGAAENFLVNVNAKPAAFQLVDAGFDVWALNSRGNLYSRQHVRLDASSPDYWDWTAVEIGKYDLAAFVRHVKDASKQQKVALVGHSQGGTIALAMLATNPGFEKDISLAVCIAGTGGSFSKQSWIMNVVTAEWFGRALEKIGVYYALDSRSVYLSKLFTAVPYLGYLFSRDRFDPTINGDDWLSIAYYVTKTPGGTSVKNLRFLGTVGREDKKIRMMDYGGERNMRLYGTEEPPVLNYSNIRTKVAVFGGMYDKLFTKEDTEHLGSILPKEQLMFIKSDYKVDHLGFTLSGNDEYLKDLIKVLNEANGKE
jgi:lysosomal acid lipase/cholesteryl ester hydrolase